MTPTTLLWLVTGCLMLQPLSTDLYLASLPGLAADFAVTPAAVQRTLSLFVFGFGSAQLVSGPLSDRYGRRPVLIGGLSVVAGAWTRIGALFLLVFLAAATFYFHDFWKFTDPTQQQLQTIQFMKNLAIGGGLLSLIAHGGGPWSVDGWISKRREEVESGTPAAKPRVTAKAS